MLGGEGGWWGRGGRGRASGSEGGWQGGERRSGRFAGVEGRVGASIDVIEKRYSASHSSSVHGFNLMVPRFTSGIYWQVAGEG